MRKAHLSLLGVLERVDWAPSPRKVHSGMCGIAGVFSIDPEARSRHRRTVEEMTAAVAHRGPDGAGHWEDATGRMFLGHRRLAILDVSEQASQPMRFGLAEAAIVFNGEIYNYLELKRELEGVDPGLNGRSDTAVLLSALVHWGPRRTLDRLVGMFAFAFWDGREGALYLARDRAGKKPLYFRSRSETFAFASEVKCFRRVASERLQVDPEAIAHYLSVGFVSGPSTAYREIQEVPAGHWMRIDGRLRAVTERYWQLPIRRDRKLRMNDAVSEADAHIRDAVRLRLRSDVPVGAFLSGGIDSGLIVAMAAHEASRPLRTFTVGFDVPSMDESAAARAVAERYGTAHEEIRLDLDIDRLVGEVARAYDEPISDTSILPTYLISREASRRVKVVLNGEGSDELFGGYRRHVAVKIHARARPLLDRLPSWTLRVLRSRMPLPRGFRTRYSFLHRFLRSLSEDPFERYLTWTTDGFTEAEKASLFPSYRGAPTAAVLAARHSRLMPLDPLGQFMALDFEVGMEDCLLVKLDRATMAHGLESRCPFLDHRLIEWCVALDYETLFPGRVGKPLLRALARRYLPRDTVTAPKRGFELPLVEWMRIRLEPWVRAVCLDPRGIVLDMFDRRAVTALLDRQNRIDQERWAKLCWILFMLGMWDREQNA